MASKSDANSPLGEASRKQAMDTYFAKAGPVTAANAWSHVYRLLLSLERRTGLAHVYDANHMQPGKNFHKRAVRFTSELCKLWAIEQKDLGAEIDVMFRHCIGLLAESQAAAAPMLLATAKPVGEFGRIAENILVDHGFEVGDQVLVELEKAAEDFYSVGNKRQNVRGEGFEDLLRYLFLHVARVPPSQLEVRRRADELPGFRAVVAGGKLAKVPKPDLAITVGKSTMWIVTAKWSLRQDRLDQFGQEYSYYRANKKQNEDVHFLLVTNELDIARLRDVLAPLHGEGGFSFQKVCHVCLPLLKATHGVNGISPLAGFLESGRLVGLEDLLNDARDEFEPTPPPPGAPAA